MDKRDNASSALFFGSSKGVASFIQSEGGGPGSPETSLLYELGVSELAQSVDDLTRDSNASQSREGVVSGRMDDSQRAVYLNQLYDFS